MDTSTEFYRGVLEASLDGYIRLDGAGALRDVNAAYCQISGYSREELIGMHMSQLGMTLPVTHDNVGQVIRTGSHRFSSLQHRKDGSVWHADVMAVFSDTHIGEMVGFLRDITPVVAAQTALAHAHELLTRTGELANIGGWEVDVQTMTQWWSLQAFRIAEMDPPHVPSLKEIMHILYAPEAYATMFAAHRAAMEFGTPFDLEVPCTTAKGRKVWVRSQGQAERRDGKVVRLFGTIQDITIRKQAQADLQEKEERLECMAREQERSAERSRILRDMHDGVGSHISAAIRQLESGRASVNDVLHTLRDSLDQLKMSIDSMNLPEGDITALLANLRFRLEPRFKALDMELQWGVDLLPPLASLHDKAMRHLQFMVFEAISNVLQHAHASVLRIELCAAASGAVQLRVIDNGRGFDPDHVKLAGLRTLRERAAILGAQLLINSEPGRTVLEIGLT